MKETDRYKKINKTDNDSEAYFHATPLKSDKKRFRTEQSIFNQIFNRKIDIKKNKIPTNKITKS